jgi:hypothetical protein
MSTTSTIDTRLMTELQRQEYYLAKLPADYEFPLFSGKQAVESQRRSGYKDTAHAAREIVDNAIESGAKNVHVFFDRITESTRGRYQRVNSVTAIAFVDDGPGMLPPMARYALSWGGGTHFEDPTGIGKFGFGLPNSSINQTRRVEVYTKTKEADEWMRAVLDINEVDSHGLLTIPEPQPAELPPFVKAYLKRHRIQLRSGTVVVWDRPDRLTYRQAGSLKEHLLNDFGVTYRGQLGDRFELTVEAEQVQKTDPLFITPDARLYIPEEDGGPRCTVDLDIPVKLYLDDETGAMKLEHIEDEDALEEARNDPSILVVSSINVKVIQFPVGFASGAPADLRDKTDAYKRFEIRKGRRGMSFVRSGREIETVDIFPKSAHDIATGMGTWPLLQSYAYHWGMLVTFRPELDEAFGVGNDKQTIRPIDDFWRVLTELGIDEAARNANQEQYKLRRKKKEEEAANTVTEEPSPATQAAATAAATTGQPKELPSGRREEAKARHEEAIRDRMRKTQEGYEQAKKAIQDQAKRMEFAIGFFESVGGVFYMPDVGNGLQNVALINKKHPFFETFYSEVINSGNPKVRAAVDLLLLALTSAELQTEDELRDMYEHQRENVWSPFLKAGLRVLERMEPTEEPEEGNELAGSNGEANGVA